MLLSPTLEFVRYVIEGLTLPYRLYFDHTTRRLFVGLWFGGVAVIQLLTALIAVFSVSYRHYLV